MATSQITFAFRAVVRGNTEAGMRVRRTRVLHADSYESAWEAFANVYRPMSKGLTDPSFSVLPPAGYLLRGGVAARFVEPG
jgi:hypothetical protein